MKPCFLVLAFAVGCGPAGGDRINSLDSPSSSVTPRSTVAHPFAGMDADMACPRREVEHLPSGMDSVDKAYLCQQGFRLVPGDGEWLYSSVRAVTGGLDELLTAYAPEDAQHGQGACTADAPSPLVSRYTLRSG